MRRTPRTIVLLLVAAAGLVACSSAGSDNDIGSDGGPTSSGPTASASSASGPADDLVALIAANLDAIEEEGAIEFTPAEAECTATRVATDVAPERLIELEAFNADLTHLEFTADERDVVFAAISSCVDLEAQLAAFFGSDPSLSPEEAMCLAEAYAATDLLPEALFRTEPDADLNQRIDDFLQQAFADCA